MRGIYRAQVSITAVSFDNSQQSRELQRKTSQMIILLVPSHEGSVCRREVYHMSSSNKPDTVIQATLNQIQKVIKDLQARPDYGPGQKASVDELNDYALLLQKFEAESAPPLSLTEEIQTESVSTMLPLVGGLIDDNIKITKMGQLSTARTITPTMAKAHNIDLETLQSDIQQIAVQPDSSDGSPDQDKDLDPDQAADELLIELSNSTIVFDSAIAEQLAVLSGEGKPPC